MLEVVVGWLEAWRMWWLKQDFVGQFVQFLKSWLCAMQLGVVVDKNYAHYIDQYVRHTLQFLV